MDVVEPCLLQHVVDGLPRALQVRGVGDLEVDDGPAQGHLDHDLVGVEAAESAAGHGGGQVVEDLDEAAAVVAVVALPAVGADAEDVAGVALRDEAQLVGDEIVGLRDRVAHEGLARERLGRVGDEVLLGQLGFERADHGLDVVGAGPVSIDLQRGGRGAALVGLRHDTPSVVVVAPPPHVRRTSRSVASSVGAWSPRNAVTSSHTPSSVSRTGAF